MDKNQKLGQCIGKLIRGENLTEESAYDAFTVVLGNEVTGCSRVLF